MSTRMPPRGTSAKPVRAASGGVPAGTPNPRRKGFLGILVVALTLAGIYAAVFVLPQSGSGSPALTNPYTAKPGKSQKPGATGTPTAVNGKIEVTEVMMSNKGAIAAEDGNYYDWIELYNPTSKQISLAGYALSDNLKNPYKFVLPAWTLDPGKYIIVFADGGKSTATELHAPFKLKASGSVLTLTDPSGGKVQSLNIPEMQSGQSYAMDAGDAAKWAPTDKVSPGFPNTDKGIEDYQKSRRASSPILINEIMANNTMTVSDSDGDYPDWLELYNPTDQGIDLTGWGLSNKEYEPKKWVFPKMTLGPKQYLRIFCSGKSRAEAGRELHTNFTLNSYDDTVLLSNFRGQIVNEVKLEKLNLKADESYGLLPGSTDKWQTFSQPTPGQPNDTDGWNALQQSMYAKQSNEPLVLQAVMSNNASTIKDQFGNYTDWISLRNQSSKSLNLKGYGLTNKSDKQGYWKFPDMSLAPGESITVFASGKSVTDSNAVNARKLHADFKISGSFGATVVLTAPDGHIADRCFVPPLRADMAYARTDGKAGFSYVTGVKPGEQATGGYPGMVSTPVFSLKPGIYDKEQTVELNSADPKAKVYYTVNGDTPTDKSTLYTGPITVKKPDKEFGATVIRAVAYRDGYLSSDVNTGSYFVGQTITLPVISISVDNDAMFNSQTGLYEKGPNAGAYPFDKANFYKRGKKGEIRAHMEVFDPDNASQPMPISQDIGLQIFGQYSRADVFKGMEFVARSVYGKGTFDYAFFPDMPYTSFKSIISKPGGQDSKNSGMRDMLTISLAHDTIQADKDVGGPEVFTQGSRFALEFVNGEFWGVTTLHEKIDVNTLAKHYPGADPAKIDLIDTTAAAKAGSNKDYKDLVNYAKTHDLSNADNYKYVSDRMDIDSYINEMTLEICCGNSDMGNIRIWKSSSLDNKFRWIYYDFCWAFWPSFVTDPKNPRYGFDIHLDIEGSSTGSSYNRALIQALLKNSGFKDKFIKQLAYNINVTFETNHVLSRIDELANQMKPYMAAEDEKWHDISTQDSHTAGFTNWDAKVEAIRNYARKHPGLLKQEMKSYFNLSDAQMKQLFPNG